MATLDLQTIKQNIYKTYFSDGIWDIVLGLIYLSFGLGVWIDKTFWYAFPIIVMVLPFALKRSISVGRVGILQFKQSQKNWLLVVYFGFWVLVIGFIFLLGSLNPSEDVLVNWLTQNLFLVVGLIIAVILILVGWLFHFRRLMGYGLISLIGFALIRQLVPAGVMLTILGIVIVVCGLLVMRNFVIQNPRLEIPEVVEN